MKDYEAGSITLEQNVESHENLPIFRQLSEENEEIDVDLTFPLSIEPKDYDGTTLDDAINDKMHPPNTMIFIVNLWKLLWNINYLNSCGDRIINLIKLIKVEMSLKKIHCQ